GAAAMLPAPMLGKGPGGGFGPGGFLGTLLDGPALTTDDVNTIKTAVETFATSYTYGATPTADQAAVDALRTSVGNVVAKHWQSIPMLNNSPPGVPTPPPTPTHVVPVATSPATVTSPATPLLA